MSVTLIRPSPNKLVPAPRPLISRDCGPAGCEVDWLASRRHEAELDLEDFNQFAMEKGWAGKVEIRIIIGTNGMTQSILVKTSSGFELLDKTAIDMVTKAKPMTPIPPALRGREFTVDIPVIFSLQAS